LIGLGNTGEQEAGLAEREYRVSIPEWTPPSRMLKFLLNHGGGFSKSSVETSRTMWSMTQSEVSEIGSITISQEIRDIFI